MDSAEREFLLAVVEEAGDDGITTDEVFDRYPELALNRKSTGATLGALQKQGKIYREEGTWYITGKGPGVDVDVEGGDDDHVNFPQQARTERPYQKGWSGYPVSVHRDPTRFGRVVRIEMETRVGGATFDIPVFGGMKIWLTTQEVDQADIPPMAAPYFGIAKLYVHHRVSGELKCSEVVVSPKETVILLPDTK